MSTAPPPSAPPSSTGQHPTPPISRGGARAAILSRLAAQGRSPDFLDEGAVSRLIDHARGSPRSLRTAVDATLALASREGASRGNAAMVGRALEVAAPARPVVTARTRRALWLAGSGFAAAAVLLIFLAPLRPARMALAPEPVPPPATPVRVPDAPIAAPPPAFVASTTPPAPPVQESPPPAPPSTIVPPSAVPPPPAIAPPPAETPQAAGTAAVEFPPNTLPSAATAGGPAPQQAPPAQPTQPPPPKPAEPSLATATARIEATPAPFAPVAEPKTPPSVPAATPQSQPAPPPSAAVPPIAPEIGVAAPPVPPSPVAAEPPTALVLYATGSPGVQQRLNSLSARLRQAGIGQVDKRAVPAGTALGRPVSFFDSHDLALAQRAAGVLASEGWPNLPVDELAPRMIHARAALRQRHVVIEIQLP